MAESPTHKRRRESEEQDAEVRHEEMTARADAWAAEFDDLEEDDQFTYLEVLATRLDAQHLAFMQGLVDPDGEFDQQGLYGEYSGEEGDSAEWGDEVEGSDLGEEGGGDVSAPQSPT